MPSEKLNRLPSRPAHNNSDLKPDILQRDMVSSSSKSRLPRFVADTLSRVRLVVRDGGHDRKGARSLREERDLLGLAHAPDRRQRIVGRNVGLSQNPARDDGRTERGLRRSLAGWAGTSVSPNSSSRALIRSNAAPKAARGSAADICSQPASMAPTWESSRSQILPSAPISRHRQEISLTMRAPLRIGASFSAR